MREIDLQFEIIGSSLIDREYMKFVQQVIMFSKDYDNCNCFLHSNRTFWILCKNIIDNHIELSEYYYSFAKGIIYFFIGDIQSVDYLNKVIKQDREADFALLLKSRIGFLSIKERISEIEKSILINPSATNYFFYGKLIEGNGQRLEALKLFKESINRNEDFPCAFTLIGEILEHQKQYKESNIYFQKAINSSFNHSSVSYNRLSNFWCKNDVSKSIEITEKAIHHFPFDYYLYERLGDYYQVSGKIQQSITAYKKFLEFRNADEMTLLKLIKLEFQVDNYENVIYYFERCTAMYQIAQQEYTLLYIHSILKQKLFDVDLSKSNPIYQDIEEKVTNKKIIIKYYDGIEMITVKTSLILIHEEEKDPFRYFDIYDNKIIESGNKYIDALVNAIIKEDFFALDVELIIKPELRRNSRYFDALLINYFKIKIINESDLCGVNYNIWRSYRDVYTLCHMYSVFFEEKSTDSMELSNCP